MPFLRALVINTLTWAQRVLARITRQRNRHPLAESEMNAHTYVPRHTVTPTYAAGIRAMTERRLTEAAEILRKEPPESPCRGLAESHLAIVLRALGDSAGAERTAEAALRTLELAGYPHPPSSVQAARALGEALVDQSRFHEAALAFNRAAHLADALAARFPLEVADLEIGKAHVFNSWGASRLRADDPKTALEILERAKEIYRKHRDRHPPGWAEALANSGLAAASLGDAIRADLSLREALDVARAQGDTAQQRRAEIALIQLGSDAIPVDTRVPLLETASAEAEAEGTLGTAHLRYCIAAQTALQLNDLHSAEAALAEARRLEPSVDPRSVDIAKRATLEALLLHAQKMPLPDQARSLIRGAHLWFVQLTYPLTREDFAAAARTLHEHFRMTARVLLDLRRVDEALAAFEFGRALAHAIEVDRSTLEGVLAANPFAADGSGVSLEALTEVQERLAPEECVLAPVVLPPDFVAFILTKSAVLTVSRALPNDPAVSALFADIRLIPSRLEGRKGRASIPNDILAFAADIRVTLADRDVTAIMPYSDLHLVPWRAVLRDAGAPWGHLPSVTVFGLLSLQAHVAREHARPALSAGFGRASVVDLAQEARDVAVALGDPNSFVPNASSADIARALASARLAYVSCHGIVDPVDGRLRLSLSDGRKILDDLLPEHVASDIVILSACESGVYDMQWGDFPAGAGPELLRRGARYVACARFRVGAEFAARFFPRVAGEIRNGLPLPRAVAVICEILEKAADADLWRDIACIELLGSNWT